jgi:Flp pilus assembly protein TadD
MSPELQRRPGPFGRPWWRRLACALVVAAAATASSDVWADALKDKAQELLTEGNRLVREGDFGAALLKYRTAFELFPSPKLLINIGTALRHTGRNAEAAATYERYLADPEADPARRAELERILADLDRLVGRLDVEAAEPDVRVSVDGQLVDLSDRHVVVRVDPGPHTVVGEKAGREASVRHLQVEAGDTERVLVVLAAPGESTEPVSPWRIVGFGLAGLGGAGLVVGGVLGALTLSAKAKADDQCAGSGRYAGYCSEEGAKLSDDARTLGTVATAAAILGFGTAATGLAIAFTAGEPDGGSVAWSLAPAPAGISVVGRW